jgi:hypothetical protein
VRQRLERFLSTIGQSGVVGVLLETLIPTPGLALTRVTFWYSIESTGDTVFLTIALSLEGVIQRFTCSNGRTPESFDTAG